jgi:hypothetical protein
MWSGDGSLSPSVVSPQDSDGLSAPPPRWGRLSSKGQHLDPEQRRFGGFHRALAGAGNDHRRAFGLKEFDGFRTDTAVPPLTRAILPSSLAMKVS